MRRRKGQLFLALIIMLAAILLLVKYKPFEALIEKHTYTRDDLKKDAKELNLKSKLPFEYLMVNENKHINWSYNTDMVFGEEKDQGDSKARYRRLKGEKDKLYFTDLEYSNEKYDLYGIKSGDKVDDANEILREEGFKEKEFENLGKTMRKGFIVVKFDSGTDQKITKTYIYTIGY